MGEEPVTGYDLYKSGDGTDIAAVPTGYVAKYFHSDGTSYHKLSDLIEHADAGLTGLTATSGDNSISIQGTGTAPTIGYKIPWLGLITGASHAFAATDRGADYSRSNSGTAMTDTLPSLNNTTDVGYVLKVHNEDTVGTITFSQSGGGTVFRGSSGSLSSSTVLYPLCRQTFIWSGANWLFDAGNANLIKSPASAPAANDLVLFGDTTGRTSVSGGQLSAKTLDFFAAAAADINLGGHKATNAGTPTSAGDLATKAYVDAVAQGLSIKGSVKAAATTAYGTPTGLTTVDGYTPSANDRILLTAQGTGSQNGIWLAQSGAWTRPLDFATGSNAAGAFTFVEGGTANAASGWVEAQTGTITIDTTTQVWTQFSGAGEITTVSADITKTGNQLSLPNVGPGVTGPIGSASVAPVVTIDAKGRITALTSATITPAAIGAPSGSGTSSGTNTGDQTLASSVTTETVSDAGQVGTSTAIARQDHRHPMPSTATTGAAGFMTAAYVQKLADMIYDVVADYGADPTGAVDATTPIQNAINAAQTAGGGIVYIPRGFFKITSTLNITNNGVWIQGAGGAQNADTGTYTAVGATWLQWKAGSSGILMKAQPSGSAGVGQALHGFKVMDLSYDCRNGDANQATIGLQMISCNGWRLDNVFWIDPITAALDLNVVAPGTLGEAADCTRGLANNLKFRVLDGAAAGAIAIRMDGSTAANACCNQWNNIAILHAGTSGTGAIEFLNSDSNEMFNVVINRASGTNPGVRFNGSNVGTANTARNNHFWGGSAGAGGVLTTAGFTFPDIDNYWDGYQVGNGEPIPGPNLANGSIFHFTVNGTQNGGQFAQMTGDALLGARLTATQTVGTALANVTGLNFPLLQPGIAYNFEAHLIGNSSSSTLTAGTGVAISAPAGATLSAAAIGPTTSTSAQKQTFFTALSTAQTGFSATTGTLGGITIKGVITAGTATSNTGTVQIMMNNAATGTVQLGSYLVARRVL